MADAQKGPSWQSGTILDLFLTILVLPIIPPACRRNLAGARLKPTGNSAASGYPRRSLDRSTAPAQASPTSGQRTAPAIRQPYPARVRRPQPAETSECARRPCPRLRRFRPAAGRETRSIPRKISTPFRSRPRGADSGHGEGLQRPAWSMDCFPRISSCWKTARSRL